MTQKAVLVVVVLWLLASCATQDTSSAEMQVYALSSADVARVTVTVSGDGIFPDIVRDLVNVSGQWQGIIGGIPVGADRTFHAEAFDEADVLIYEGEITGITIERGRSALVIIRLQESTPSDPFANAVPMITGLAASANAVVPEETVSLSVAAHDPDADALTYEWTSDGGSFNDSSSTTPIWTAPAVSALYMVTITVSDGRGGTTVASFAIDVNESHGRGRAQVEAEFNTWPEVAGVTATPGRINVSEITTLDVTASDNDGDILAYAWTDEGGECTGSFSNPAIEDPTWTAPAVLPASRSCTLTVTVTDGRGGTNTGSVTVLVAPPEEPNIAPIIDSTFQSTEVVAPGETVVFRVQAHDPEGGAVSFDWIVSDGILGIPVESPGESEVTWTAPADPINSPYTITAVVSDPEGEETFVDFEVWASGDPCYCGVPREWHEMAPAVVPPARFAHAMAYDARCHEVLMFGGYSSGYLSETWVYDGATWEQLHPAVHPPLATFPSMTFDPVRGVVVLFGGAGCSTGGGGCYNEGTWEWDCVTREWEERHPALSPLPRDTAAMVYDSARNVMVLFGGRNMGTIYDQTWEYDGTTWERIDIAGPPARMQSGMSYDAARGVIVLFGGYGAGGVLVTADTWEYDGMAWRRVLEGGGPHARSSHTIVYDSGCGLTLLFGGVPGSGGAAVATDTWTWDGTEWTNITPVTGPLAGYDIAGTYDNERCAMVIYGGRFAWDRYSDETWEFSSP